MKKLKRLGAFAIAVVMGISLLPSVSASETEDLKKLVSSAKTRLGISAEYTEFTSSKSEVDGEHSYNLNWETEDGKKTINALIKESGEITKYNKYGDKDYEKAGVAAFSEETYVDAAKSWISRVNPSFVKELDFDVKADIGSIYSYSVYVEFERKINGIAVAGDYVSISLDKYTGEVSNMTVRWHKTDKVFESDNIISLDEAKKILGENAEVTLCYQYETELDKAVPVYYAKNIGKMINAETGEDFEVEYIDTAENEKFNTSEDVMTPSAPSGGGGGSNLTEQEIADIEKLTGLMSEGEVKALIAKMAGTDVASFTPTNISYSKVEDRSFFRDNNGEKAYRYEVRVYLADGENGSGTVTLDAETGELLSLYSYKYDDNSSKKYNKSRKELRGEALKFVDRWASDVAEEVSLFDETDDSEGGGFSFLQSVNGIRFDGNNIRVNVDAKSGKITRFTKNWDGEVEFAPLDGIISLEEATKSYVEAAGASLCYVPNGISRYYGNDNAREFALIYELSYDAPPYISAYNGQALDWELSPYGQDKEEYVIQPDLKGHFAEKAISELAKNGIVLCKDELFRPDAPLMTDECVSFIEVWNHGGEPFIRPNLVYELVRQGIIREGERMAPVLTRELAVSYVVRLVGMEKAAVISGIYKTGFADENEISSNRIGYVAIAKGLKIVGGSGNGRFEPQRGVTRGEFAVMLYNALYK